MHVLEGNPKRLPTPEMSYYMLENNLMAQIEK